MKGKIHKYMPFGHHYKLLMLIQIPPNTSYTKAARLNGRLLFLKLFKTKNKILKYNIKYGKIYATQKNVR
jgi:hypothetical protein